MAKSSADRNTVRELLKEWFLENPNTPLDSKTAVATFGEENRHIVNQVLNQAHSRVISRATGKRNAGAPGTDELLRALEVSGPPTTVTGVLYRCGHATYVYDTDAYYRRSNPNGVKRRRFPLYHSITSSEAPQVASAPEPSPNPHPGGPEQQVELPFPTAGDAPEPSELATTLIEADRANRESQGRLSERDPREQSLPAQPVDHRSPFEVKVLARGDETIVIQTATEVITATIVVAVPR